MDFIIKFILDMIILLILLVIAVILFVPIKDSCIKVYNMVKEYRKPKATRDSIFRIVQDVDGNIYIQFSKNGSKFYRYSDTRYYDLGSAKCELDKIVEKLNRSEKILHEYNPYSLRITDGSEKEFQESEYE